MEGFFSTHLWVEGFTLNLSVGCNEEEKKRLQPIEIDLCLIYSKKPEGCLSDRLEDTICYEKCLQIVRQAASHKHFQLIEHLAFEIHRALKNSLPEDLEVGVRVGKVHPPLADVRKPIRFSYFGK